MFLQTKDILADLPAYCEKNNLMGSLANISALLMTSNSNLNWLGFYLFDGEKLILGPFQGRPACTAIALGKGVCGTAATTRKTQRVGNVHQFSGHIACDSETLSELVIPIIQENKLVGVLDVDSPLLNRFSEQDQVFYENVVKVLIQHLEFEV